MRAFRADCEDVSGEALVSAPLREAPGVLLGRVRAQIVRMPQAVCLLAYPTSLAFGGVCEDVSGQALASALPGGRQRGYCTGAFAPGSWGCLRRFACSRAQHLSPSEQFLRMSQARRWFQHSQRGGAPGVRTLQDSRPDCGDVSGGLPVCVLNILCFRSSF